MWLTVCSNCVKKQLFGYNLGLHAAFKRHFNKHYILFSKLKFDIFDISPQDFKLASIIQKYDDRIQYSSYLEARRLKLGYKQNAIVMAKKSRKEEKQRLDLECTEPLPLSLKYLNNNNNNENTSKCEHNEIEKEDESNSPTHFPFEIKECKMTRCNHTEIEENNKKLEYKNIAEIEINERLKELNANNWMADYENYNEEELHESNDWRINYGTPDPHSNVSNVPCGGCGALLHCKDTAIPGYIPSEIYKNHRVKGGTSLHAITCQRCYFLNNYNLALQVQVSPEEYPQVLKTISQREKALVLLMVDLLDYPCSIWPGAADLLGPGRPIFLIGNKIDLLPQDGKKFLQRVAEHLQNSARLSGFAATNIKHVALISATTGFGIEDLITKMHSFWEYRGDVFLVGCTNVGKSSLFNALLQSDFCKSQATDLIQRATVSQWPGTTLNLLKFPILRMSGHRSYLRYKRLTESNKQISQENNLRKQQLQKTRNPKYASLIGHIGTTFSTIEPVTSGDPFFVSANSGSVGKVRVGINEKNEEYALSKWCYDTPGVIQPEQLLHLLTTEELTLTLPKKLIKPRTFSLRPGSSIFIGGLGRLDYLEGKPFSRFTVFCSSSLPITICKTEIADELYQELLGTEFFAVPAGNSDRLKFWPGLKRRKSFTVKGIDWNYSCADIVLSSSGWVAIAGGTKIEYQVKAWVPENCGIYLRDSLLPSAVSLRGKRIRDSPAYQANKFYIPP